MTFNRRAYLLLTRKDGEVGDRVDIPHIGRCIPKPHVRRGGHSLLRDKASTKREFWSTAVNRYKSSWIAGSTIYCCWNTNALPYARCLSIRNDLFLRDMTALCKSSPRLEINLSRFATCGEMGFLFYSSVFRERYGSNNWDFLSRERGKQKLGFFSFRGWDICVLR